MDITQYYYRIERGISDIRLEIKWAWQRAFRGWDDTAKGGMGEYLSEIIIDVLKYYRDEAWICVFWKVDKGCADNKINKEYNKKKINEMIEGFKIIRYKDWIKRTDEEHKKVKNTLNMLANKFEHFWD